MSPKYTALGPAVINARLSQVAVTAVTVPANRIASRAVTLGLKRRTNRNAPASARAVCWYAMAAAARSPATTGHQRDGDPTPDARRSTTAPAHAAGAMRKLSGTA